MILTMHGMTTMHCNIVTDIRIARETGYEALEVLVPKLLRYLDSGRDAADLLPIFEAHSIRPVCLNALVDVERVDLRRCREVLTEAERLSTSAEVLGARTVQLVPLCGLQGRPWRDVLTLTARNIADIADIGRAHGIRFQLEPIAWSPIHSLSQSLQVIDKTGRDNVGVVIDFWHLFAGGATTPDDVARLDKSLIYGVHFCDGIRHREGTRWVEGDLRGFLPGEGQITVQEWVSAVKTTGFDGVWSSELYSPKHWEWDLWRIARECRERMERYVC